MNDLDEAERRAIEMIRFFQEECRKQCEPYVKILMNIEAMRPQVYVLDGKTNDRWHGSRKTYSASIRSGVV